MEQWVDKNRKTIFYLVVVVCFFAILIFNIFTPNMSDDLGYGAIVKQANSFWDLFGQEYEHHMMHSGRNVAHLILRIFLYQGNKVIFNIFNYLVYCLLISLTR